MTNQIRDDKNTYNPESDSHRYHLRGDLDFRREEEMVLEDYMGISLNQRSTD